MVMNFIHATSVIMAVIISSTFGSVDNMLSGKKFPKNFRAHRMLVEEVLCDVLQMPGITSFSQLIKELDARASRSRTTKMWKKKILSRQLSL